MYRGDSAKGLSPEVPTTWTVLPAQVQPGKGVSAAPFSLLSGRGDKDAHRLDPGRGEEQRTFGLRLKEEQTIISFDYCSRPCHLKAAGPYHSCPEHLSCLYTVNEGLPSNILDQEKL